MAGSCVVNDVTRILDRVQQGDPTAADELLPLVYEELRKLAAPADMAGIRNQFPEADEAERRRILGSRLDLQRRLVRTAWHAGAAGADPPHGAEDMKSPTAAARPNAED